MRPEIPTHCPICNYLLDIDNSTNDIRYTCFSHYPSFNHNDAFALLLEAYLGSHYGLLVYHNYPEDYAEVFTFGLLIVQNTVVGGDRIFEIRNGTKKIFSSDKRIVISSEEQLKNFLMLI